ncbi:MAG: hypothetical protein STSR0004_21400 [Peptococcaceae bacterium]
MYAVGLRNLGELYLFERTIYEFRRRVYRYTIENPDKNDLIFGQFEKLTGHFIELVGLNTEYFLHYVSLEDFCETFNKQLIYDKESNIFKISNK